MKVLLLGVQLTSLVIFRRALICDLIAAGHEVVAIAPEPTAERIAQLQALGARYIEPPMARTGTNPLRDIKLLLWLWRVLRREQPNVLLAFQAKAVIYGLLAGWLAGVPRRVAMIEGLGQAFIPGSRGGLRRRVVQFVVPLLYRISLRFAHRVIFLNPDDEADFIRLHLVQPQQVGRIPGIGVDLSRFAPLPLPEGPFTFLINARLIIDKGIRELMAAAAIVKQKFPQVRFLLIGAPDTSHVGISQQEIIQQGAIEYLGFVDDVRMVLAKCHAFILPSYREGMPISTIEAMAAARAVITTDVPGARETVIDKLNGYLVKPRDPNALATAMFRLMENPAALGEMGQASRRLAEERFDVVRINQTIMAELGVKQ